VTTPADIAQKYSTPLTPFLVASVAEPQYLIFPGGYSFPQAHPSAPTAFIGFP